MTPPDSLPPIEGESDGEPRAETDRPAGTPVGRRVVIGMLGLGALGVAFGQPLSNAVARLGRQDPTGLTSVLPAAGGFRYYSVVSNDPVVTPDAYRLNVGGLVESPRTMTFADLAALPQTSMTKDFQCVTGWRVPDVLWSGVLLRDLLALVRPKPGAGAVNFTSFDGEYTESLTMEQAMRPDVLVATAMMGKPVSNDHGGPVRLYVAPMYGYKSLKWLGGIQVAAQVDPGYWEVRGYDTDAWVGRSNGRSDAPTV